MPTGLDHHLHRLSLELRAELPAMFFLGTPQACRRKGIGALLKGLRRASDYVWLRLPPELDDVEVNDIQVEHMLGLLN
jgi:hypothetical protein